MSPVTGRSKRRAHHGGRSEGGKTHAMFARRQFEHGDDLSQRTFRLRHTIQLRSFATADVVWRVPSALADGFALFSAFEAEACALPRVADIVAGSVWDILAQYKSNQPVFTNEVMNLDGSPC